MLGEVIPGVDYVAEVDTGIANEGWTRKNMMTVKAMEILGRDSALAEAAFLHPIMMSCDGERISAFSYRVLLQGQLVQCRHLVLLHSWCRMFEARSVVCSSAIGSGRSVKERDNKGCNDDDDASGA